MNGICKYIGEFTLREAKSTLTKRGVFTEVSSDAEPVLKV